MPTGAREKKQRTKSPRSHLPLYKRPQQLAIMGLTYPSIPEKIRQQRETIAELEQSLIADSRRLAVHNIVRVAPMPWISSLGPDAQAAGIPHWVPPEEIALLNLPAHRLWQEIRRVLHFHHWQQGEPDAEEQCRLRVNARAAILDVMLVALKDKLEKERQKLADLITGRTTR